MRFSRLLLFLFSISILFSCGTNKAVNKCFNDSQKADLEKLVSFFTKEMCDDKTDFKTCFKSHLPELLVNGWMPVLDNVDFENQQTLYASFESDLFNEIWMFCPARSIRDSIVTRILCPTNSGSYIRFLERLSNKNKSLKYYYDHMLQSGDFEPMGNLQHMIYNKPEYFDLNDFDIQVLIAVHFLSLNDSQKRNEPWEGPSPFDDLSED